MLCILAVGSPLAIDENRVLFRSQVVESDLRRFGDAESGAVHEFQEESVTRWEGGRKISSV